jgi:hypothetical protein
LTVLKSRPLSVFLVPNKSTLSSFKSMPASRATMCGDSEHAPGA